MDTNKLPQCELCNADWFGDCEDLEEINSNAGSISQTKRCLLCYEEWGDSWPDQV